MERKEIQISKLGELKKMEVTEILQIHIRGIFFTAYCPRVSLQDIVKIVKSVVLIGLKMFLAIMGGARQQVGGHHWQHDQTQNIISNSVPLRSSNSSAHIMPT